MRDKLIELLRNNYGEFMMYTKHHKSPLIFMTSIDNLADFLIENGAKIPVRCDECRKRKTEECGMNLKTAYYYHSWEDDEDYCSYGEPKEREE